MATNLLTITRKWQTAVSTVSAFTGTPEVGSKSCARGITGYILEEKGPSTTVRNQDRRIPAGVYKLKWHASPRFGKTLPLLYNDLVPASRYILIHSGNTARDTEGCLLVGATKAENSVGSSRIKLDELLQYLGCFDLNSGNFTLEIKESF